MKLFTAEQMRAIDQQAIHEGQIPGVRLMHNAGMAIVAALEEYPPCAQGAPLVVCAGPGNNGGDGFVVARLMQQRGWAVQTLVLAEASDIEGDAGYYLNLLLHDNGKVDFCPDSSSVDRVLGSIMPPGLIVDALLGTGINSEVREPFARTIRWINHQGTPIISVDIPSGVGASDGRIWGCAVIADRTLTFGGTKVGLLSFPGSHYTGAVEQVDIGIPNRYLADADSTHGLVDAQEARSLFRPADVEAHKGSRGHVLVAAGSRGKTGAAILASQGALRAGAGLVSLACPQSLQAQVAGQMLEVMTEGTPEKSGAFSASAAERLLELQAGKSAMVFGSGIGTGRDQQKLVAELVRKTTIPLVIDADGLNALVGQQDILRESPVPLVLTPHPGEMSRLCNLSIDEVQADRLSLAQEFARRYGVTLVLKGAGTVIATGTGRIWLNGSGNPALATAGTGDVLAGTIAALLAQGYTDERAAMLGAFLHGAAADRLAKTFGEVGLIASDLLAEIPCTRKDLLEGDWP